MSKYFLISPEVKPSSNKDIQEIEMAHASIHEKLWDKKRETSKEVIKDEVPLKWVEGRVIVKADLEYKNQVTFVNGTTIRLERKFNEFNRRITQPVNAIVVSAENIPTDAEILISHNALHDTNKIFSYKNLTDTGDVKYYSLPETDCFAWRVGEGEFQPTKNFEFGLRVYEPYKGIMEGIDATLVKDVLYITTGELKGQVVHTLKASDYTIIYQGNDGREKHLIRCRHFGKELNEAEELVAISYSLTEKVKKSEFHIGLSEKDCKPLKDI